MEDSSMDQTQTAEFTYWHFIMLSLLSIFSTSLPLVLRDFYQPLWWHEPGYSAEDKCFILEIWTSSHFEAKAILLLQVFFLGFMSFWGLSQSQVLYWKWHSTKMRSPLIAPAPLSSLDWNCKRHKKVNGFMGLSDSPVMLQSKMAFAINLCYPSISSFQHSMLKRIYFQY